MGMFRKQVTNVINFIKFFLRLTRRDRAYHHIAIVRHKDKRRVMNKLYFDGQEILSGPEENTWELWLKMPMSCSKMIRGEITDCRKDDIKTSTVTLTHCKKKGKYAIADSKRSIKKVIKHK